MFIKEIEIFSFGCLENMHFVFSDKFNLIYGPNESGKSTFFAFIKFMFYGTKIKKNPSELSFKNKYMPLNGKPMSGRLIFKASDNHTYILERFCSDTRNEVSLYNLDTSSQLKDTSVLNAVGEFFFGVNADSFSKTAFLSAFSANINDEKSGELITKLSNVFESGSDEVSYRQISDIIKNEISLLSSNKRKKSIIPELESDIQQLGVKIYDTENIIKSSQSLEEDVQSDKIKLEELTLEIDKIKQERDSTLTAKSDNSSTMKFLKLFLISVSLLCIVLMVWYGFLSFIIPALIFIGILIFVIIPYNYNKQKNNIIKKDFTIKDFNDKINILNNQVEMLRIDIAVKTERKNNLTFLKRQLEELQSSMHLLKEKLSKEKEKLCALQLALAALEQAYCDIKSVFAPELTKRTGIALAELTENKYTSVLIEDNFSVNVKTKHGYVDAAMLSRGTIEQIYLAVRLALVELIFNDVHVPLFIDDALAFYDFPRLKSALELLYNMSESRQVFFSTCRVEEYELLKTKQINAFNFERND